MANESTGRPAGRNQLNALALLLGAHESRFNSASRRANPSKNFNTLRDFGKMTKCSSFAGR